MNSQGFDCEIDDRDWILCEPICDELTISFQTEEGNLGGVTLGVGQVQNLIEFLVAAKKDMQSFQVLQVERGVK